MKKIKIFALCMVMVLCIGGIAAYFTSHDKEENKITIGENKTQIVEEFDPPEKLKPGVSFRKDVKVANLGPSDCYVRIKAVFTDGGMEKYCDVDYNMDDFAYSKDDGYYYYTKVLENGKKSPSLFTTVKLDDDIPENAIKEFDILVYTESYQSRGFHTYEDAWEHFQINKPVK